MQRAAFSPGWPVRHNRGMTRLFGMAALFAAMSVALLAQADWSTATDLPNVDFTGLTPAQKETALNILRKESCTCGCQMKLAQCRVLDPPCSDSKALASIVVEGVRNRRSVDEIHQALVTSPIAKMRAEQNRILGDPVVLNTSGAPVRGPAGAKITLVEFSDFECPYCQRAFAEINAIMKAYPDQVKLIFKQYPLDMHPHALMAAEASLAANDQGKFWPMHDQLFEHARQLSPQVIFSMAKDLGLDMTRFTRDLETGRFRKAIAADVAEGEKDGVFGTPFLFIDGKPYRGPVELAVMKPILDAELKPQAQQQAAAR
jgi:protein-disulfide isomerase